MKLSTICLLAMQGALMKGIGATTVRAFLVNGVIFSVYDFSMRTMQAIGA